MMKTRMIRVPEEEYFLRKKAKEKYSNNYIKDAIKRVLGGLELDK
jgi:hypothetical protein